MILSFAKSMSKNAVIGYIKENHQTLWITPSALRHVHQHRQSMPWATEAGGQLFGSIDTEQICLTEVSGPYAGDERSRYRYRSNPAAAQRAIEEHHKRGLLYLGEWHTHAEETPSASHLDDDAMRRLISCSRLNSDALLMMIVGRSQGIAGLVVWNVSSKNMRQWILRESSESNSLQK